MASTLPKHFRDEAAAFEYFERMLWYKGRPECPHCGTVGKAGRLKGVKGQNGEIRHGLWKCYVRQCGKQFTIKIGTVFERTHMPMQKILRAVHLLFFTTKKITGHELSRRLRIDYKSAWLLEDRIKQGLRTRMPKR